MRGVILVLAILGSASSAFAHCDAVDGPVVRAAQEALTTGDVNAVLIWVGASYEAEVSEIFTHTLEVRKLSPAAQALADRYFFETLVRLHRAGEGEPYTGLKPAGEGSSPLIAMSDEALKSGNPQSLTKIVTEHARTALLEKLNAAIAAKNYDPDDVEGGRAYVRAYVEFIHFIDRLSAAIHGREQH